MHMSSCTHTQRQWHSRVGFLVDLCLLFFIIKIIASFLDEIRSLFGLGSSGRHVSV